MKVVMEGVVDPKKEDGGMALIAEGFEHNPHEPNGMFVRLQSWDEKKEHITFNQFVGKKVRVTVEVVS
ncbi:hypothetical protein CcrColossus_gp404 [Caulobacter phage CcrColossus]|uniref:Uncharacterized protein n=1 Tax=Caulobacter phage CcrColossus TaxID=1211640 RepID=K4JSE8_9CAUD|nr:hypothetical protein CcrColossus_gp404 [Caulobacter phage CcrColossus]AFU88274.1 hypothetical protein CcrColossus_gp404 [Caulobacter phage CcrColossus]